MKLIRLTSDDPTALFDCDFNGGINIPENSKMALQSVSANLQGGSFLVDGSNKKIFFQISDTYIKEADLDDFLYFEGNTQDLLNDIMNKINDQLVFVTDAGLRKLLGMEWNAKIGQAGKAVIGYRCGRAESWSGVGTSTTPNLWDMNNTEFGLTTGLGNTEILGAKSTETPTDTFSNNCILPHGCSRGVGYIRARISELTDTGATNTNGMIIGFSKTIKDPEDLEERDIHLGIRLGLDNATGALYYALIIDGVEQPRSAQVPHIQAPKSIRNDTLELMIDGNRINANIYNAQVLNTPPVTLGFSAYENDYLFPVFFFFGDRTRATFNQVRFTASPYYVSSINLNQPSQNQDDTNEAGAGLSAPPSPPSNLNQTNNRLTFQSTELAEYLGYSFRVNPPFSPEFKAEADFIGSQPMTVGLQINGFIIQLLNVSVESYDSLKQQRENILAVIPSTDGSGDLNYSPPFMIPIDLNNSKPMSLRNIKARIVRTDYSPFVMEGTGLINIVIQ